MKLLQVVVLSVFSVAIKAATARSKRSVVSDEERGVILAAIINDLEQEKEGADEKDVKMRRAMATFLKGSGNTTLTNDVPDWILAWYETTIDEFDRSICEPECGGFIDLSPIWGYGCWCFFGEHAGKGFGHPVNIYDEICKSMTHCYRCAQWDGEQEGTECDPWNAKYQVNMDHVLNEEGIQGECMNKQNPDNCQWRTCSCEMAMIGKFFRLVFDPTAIFDESYKHSNGFDFKDQCVGNGQGSGDKGCCGYYPNRKSYNTGPNRDCCMDKTLFNPNTLQCCDDGSLTGIGNTCLV